MRRRYVYRSAKLFFSLSVAMFKYSLHNYCSVIVHNNLKIHN